MAGLEFSRRWWVVLSACSGRGGALRARAPSSLPIEQIKCERAVNHDSPLVTEWSASEKANLEAQLHEGGVVVAYVGCSMRILPQCRIRGLYGWRRTSAMSDVIEIHDDDELYAKLPLGAVSLKGELARSDKLAVQSTMSGQFALQGWDQWVPEGPGCVGATHVVGMLSVGAFKLRAGGSLSAQGEVGVNSFGAGMGTSSGELILREAGSAEACRRSSDQSPDADCRSPIQAFLWPLSRDQADRGPAGLVKLNFYSANPRHKYDVLASNRALCTTPCSRWLDPGVSLMFQHDPGFLEIRPQGPNGGIPVQARAPGLSLQGVF